MTDQSIYSDKLLKHQKHPHFEHRTAKLYRKNNEFTNKKFQRVRHVSNKKNLVRSLKHIGVCLNDRTPDEIPKEGLQKVCLILINHYHHDKHDPKIGPLNDAYMLGLNHHRLGFNIFYLRNCEASKYPQFLEFFLKYTLQHLTVFYSGRNEGGVEFKDRNISSSEFGKMISENYNGRCKAIFISDSACGGSVFNINPLVSQNRPTDVISLYANKSTDPDSKEGRRSHGIFTYYLCKILNECPNITPVRLADRMNPSLKRFNMTFGCEVTNHDSENQPLFK